MEKFNSKWIVLIGRLYLGFTLFLAGLTKLFHPGILQFFNSAEKLLQPTIIGGLIPTGLLILVPFLELLLGAFLILGLERLQVLIITGFLVGSHSLVLFLGGDQAGATFNAVLLMVVFTAINFIAQPFYALDGVLSDG
ncbi:MAG: DoxX family membrane protein [bacterium]